MESFFFTAFFENNKGLLQEFQQFDKAHRLNLVDKLRRTTVKVDFLATVSEIRFGIYLSKYAETVCYDKDVFPDSKLTPDWTFVINGQEVTAEVLRINASEEDLKMSDFEENLATMLKEIQIPVWLRFRYSPDIIKYTSIKRNEFIGSMREWLSQKPTEGESITMEGVTFSVMKYHESATYVLLLGGFHMIKHDLRRLMSDSGRFMHKVNKYGDLSIKHNKPFIICIYMHTESWLHPEELSNSLYGGIGMFESDFEFNGMYPGTHFRMIQNGLYYNNMKVKQSVSGVLLRYNDSYSFYPNFFHENKLHAATMIELIKIRQLHTESCPLVVRKG